MLTFHSNFTALSYKNGAVKQHKSTFEVLLCFRI